MLLNSLANTYILSELLSGTINANDEVSTTDLVLTWFDFCVQGSDKTGSYLSKKIRVVYQRTAARRGSNYVSRL